MMATESGQGKASQTPVYGVRAEDSRPPSKLAKSSTRRTNNQLQDLENLHSITTTAGHLPERRLKLADSIASVTKPADRRPRQALNFDIAFASLEPTQTTADVRKRLVQDIDDDEMPDVGTIVRATAPKGTSTQAATEGGSFSPCYDDSGIDDLIWELPSFDASSPPPLRTSASIQSKRKNGGVSNFERPKRYKMGHTYADEDHAALVPNLSSSTFAVILTALFFLSQRSYPRPNMT
jgi:hypothetical protein